MGLAAYQRAIQGQPSPKIVQAARLALGAIAAVMQTDGLTIAKPDYPMKYLMDNVEVYGGLTEGAAPFESVGDHDEAQKARQMSMRLAAALRRFWSPKHGCFAIALHMKGKYSVGLEKPYPHGLAQLFALAQVEPGRTELWREVRKRFKPGNEAMPVERG